MGRKCCSESETSGGAVMLDLGREYVVRESGESIRIYAYKKPTVWGIVRGEAREVDESELEDAGERESDAVVSDGELRKRVGLFRVKKKEKKKRKK